MWLDNSIKFVPYSIETIRDEVHHLVATGTLDRQQPIYTLCKFIPARDWPGVEWELECNGYLLRDRLIDLLPKEIWRED
jgi:hypothetical protein